MEDLITIVRNDIRCHRENGVSLNPFSTAGCRHSWQKGFDNKPANIADHMHAYVRGALASQALS